MVTLREKLDHYISLQYRVLKSYNIWRGLYDSTVSSKCFTAVDGCAV